MLYGRDNGSDVRYNLGSVSMAVSVRVIFAAAKAGPMAFAI